MAEGPPPGDPGPDAAGRWSHLRRQATRPDLDTFLDSVGPLEARELAAIVRIDQDENWCSGRPIPAESYLERYPDLRDDPEAALDVILGEFLLRERLGECPDPDEFLGRFPEHASAFRKRIEPSESLASTSDDPDDTPTSDPDRPSGTGSPTLPLPGVVGDPLGADDPPESFGRYRILRRIGRGGMGTVYLARDGLLDRQVALKIPRIGRDENTLARFRREARIAATFTHPNLCPVFDIGQHDGVDYLTMPFLRGEPLSDRLAREGPSIGPGEAAGIAAKVARALQCAHEAGVIHRDLKPANIMLDDRGEPIVMDFGLALRETPRELRETAEGVLLGTPAYLPPEQVGGDRGDATPRSDIYSLGIILYEMLAGRPPYRGRMQDLLLRILAGEPEPPSAYCPGLDPDLERICLTAMAKEPANRFPSMATFADALDGWLRGDRTSPSPNPRSKPRPLVRRPAIIALAAALLGAIAIFAASSRGPSRRPAPSALGFRSGTTWAGRFLFRPPIADYDGDVEVVVAERLGNSFRGTYATEGDAYRWEIAGTLEGDAVRWEFSRAIHLAREADIVGKAWVEGTFKGDRLEAVFRNPGKGIADMVLRRRE